MKSDEVTFKEMKEFFQSGDIMLTKDLNDVARGYLLLRSDLITKKKGDVLIREGDSKLDYLYLLYKGEVTIYKDDQQISVRAEKETIGEMIVFTVGKKRQATVKISSDEALLVRIAYESFQYLKEMLPEEYIKLQHNMLDITWERFQ